MASQSVVSVQAVYDELAGIEPRLMVHANGQEVIFLRSKTSTRPCGHVSERKCLTV